MGLAVKATSNIDAVEADIDAFGQAIATAMLRTMSKLGDQAKTAGQRKVNDIYKIGPRTMDPFTTIKLHSANDPGVDITVKGAGFPLYAFNPRPTTRGVSVSIKGRRVLIPHAFIATLGLGHTGVFARGAYGGKGSGFQPRKDGDTFGKFIFGRKRLPINELFTLSPADAWDNPEVVQAMEDRVDEQAPVVFKQEFRYASRAR